MSLVPLRVIVALGVLVLCSVPHAYAQNLLTTYPVNWTFVPVVQPVQTCAGSPNSGTAKNLSGNCICNLQPSQCDVGCCCDPLCPSGLKSLYTSSGTCLPEGPPRDSLMYCVSSGIVDKVNLPANSEFFAIYTRPANQRNFWEALMCVDSDNNPKLGPEYPDPAAGNCGNNDALAQCPADLPQPITPTSYQYKSLIRIQRTAGSTTSVPLTVPYPALSAECNDQFEVGYLLSVPAGVSDNYATCIRSMDKFDPAVACVGSGLFTPARYTSFTFVTGQGTNNQPVLPQAVTVVQMLYEDPVTGSLTPVNANSTIASYNATTRMCSNVVKYLNYTMYYSLMSPSSTNTPGFLLQIEASIVITDISAATGSTFTQNTHVAWADFSNSGSSFVRAWSGNPGYLYGFPVLAGFRTNQSLGNTSTAITKIAIERLTMGLPMFVPGAQGACSPTSLEGVPYGYDAVSQCALSLTANDLRDYCNNAASLPDAYMAQVLGSLYPKLLSQSLYVGIWGNANTSLVDQWVQLQVSPAPSTSPVYSASDNSCSGVVTSAYLQLLTGLAYAANNVQRKVLYARLCFKTGTWDFREDGPAVQKFYLTYNVSFQPLVQEPMDVSRPVPPLAGPLPADIFYPFVTSESSGLKPPAWLLKTLATALMVLLLSGALL